MAWTKETHREYMRELRAWCREHHVCVACNRDEVIPGKKYCSDCAEKARLRSISRSRAERDKANERAAEKYHEFKDKGICVKCRKYPSNGKALCPYCLAAERKRHIATNRENGRMPREIMGDGYHCSMCGKEPLPGKKLCKDCYEKVCVSLVKARAAKRKTDPWRTFVFGKKVEQ